MLKQKIFELIETRKAKYVDALKINDLSRIILIEISLANLRPVADKNHTSEKQAKNLAKAISELSDYKCEIVWKVDEKLSEIEAATKTLIETKFPGIISDATLSFSDGTTASAFLSTSESIDQSVTENIKSYTARSLEEFGLTCKQVTIVPPARPSPTMLQILRSIKICAPGSLEAIDAHLRSIGFECPSNRWLASKIDAARKRDLVLWQENRTYVMTAEGLAALPLSTKKNSSDIDRMLHLSRRTTW